MKFFILLFIIAISINNGFYNEYNLYFGREDIVNYQRLNQNTDLFHLNTYILDKIFGEKNFFIIIMPIIIFIILPISINHKIKDMNRTRFILTSTGLIFFYWIVGLYSQCIAHIFYNYYISTKKKRYFILAILNHPTVLITYGIMNKKILYIILSVLIVYIILPNDLLYYTFLVPEQNLLGMLFILMNPLLWFYKSRVDLNHFIGLISSNMRITFYTLAEKADIPDYHKLQTSSYIWFILLFFIHYLMLIQTRL